MTEQGQEQPGKIFWAIADHLRGAENTDNFRDYMRKPLTPIGGSKYPVAHGGSMGKARRNR